MKKIIPFLILFICCVSIRAQFAPQVGYGANNAVYKDSSVIKSWATGCTIFPGKEDISNSQSPLVSIGEATYATGPAGGGTLVSLGDGGSAILTFDKFIINGEGPDFAIFENGFAVQDVGNAFLELAYVEVSSNGIDFYRFPAISNTDTTAQVASYGTLDARKIHNLAGKYTAGYGTPFDLEELKTIPGLDVNHITHIKITDVIGSMNNTYATRDSRGVKVNDPWPTPFPSSGFDLDAVAVINQGTVASIVSDNSFPLQIYPNPVSSPAIVYLQNKAGFIISDVHLYNTFGQKIKAPLSFENQTTSVDFTTIPCGVYYLHIVVSGAVIYHKIIRTE